MRKHLISFAQVIKNKDFVKYQAQERGQPLPPLRTPLLLCLWSCLYGPRVCNKILLLLLYCRLTTTKVSNIQLRAFSF